MIYHGKTDQTTFLPLLKRWTLAHQTSNWSSMRSRKRAFYCRASSSCNPTNFRLVLCSVKELPVLQENQWPQYTLEMCAGRNASRKFCLAFAAYQGTQLERMPYRDQELCRFWGSSINHFCWRWPSWRTLEGKNSKLVVFSTQKKQRTAARYKTWNIILKRFFWLSMFVRELSQHLSLWQLQCKCGDVAFVQENHHRNLGALVAKREQSSIRVEFWATTLDTFFLHVLNGGARETAFGYRGFCIHKNGCG